MAANDAYRIEATVRTRMRRQQIANTLLILLFAAGLSAAGAWFVVHSDAWHRHAPRKARATAVVAPPTAPAVVVRPPAPIAAESSVRAPSPAVAPAPKPIPPPPVQPPGPAPMLEPSPPTPAPHPVSPEPRIAYEPLTTDTSALEMPSADAAKRMLVSIKCFDDFAYEHQAKGRHYFSAMCESGTRRSVSCAGAGCKIEYAPPPSHVP